MTRSHQVVGIGNAVSDVISNCSDAFLSESGIEKGIMHLIERNRAEHLYNSMSQRIETPGGSVANTIAGLGAMGAKAAFIGRVADDALGRRYAQAMADDGTDFPNPPVANATLPTSRSMIFVSPDGERSMNTYLGISSDVSPQDVPDHIVHDCDLLFLEGYLFDKNPGKAAFYKAADCARETGARAGITLSDPFCVERHRADFRKLVAGPLDYFLSNEEELKSLYQTDDLDIALALAAEDCDLVACTRSQKGVTVVQANQRWDVPVTPVIPVDATGAGDQFAAGFIKGMIDGCDPETCGRMGTIAASEVIAHLGPRPEISVTRLLKQAGL